MKSMGVFLPALDFSPGGGWLPGVSGLGMNTISMLWEADRKALQDTKVISPLYFNAFTLKKVIYLNPSLGLHLSFAKAEVEPPCFAATEPPVKRAQHFVTGFDIRKESRMTLQGEIFNILHISGRHRGLCESHDNWGKCNCGHQLILTGLQPCRSTSIPPGHTTHAQKGAFLWP